MLIFLPLRWLAAGIVTLCLWPTDPSALEASIEISPITLESSERLSLREVVRKAYLYSPNLQVLNARLDEAQAIKTQAESLWASDVAISVRNQNDLIGANYGALEWENGFEFPIWLPGQKSARKTVAEKLNQLVNASEQSLKLSIAGLVRQSLWTIALQENQAELAKWEWEIAKKLENDVAKRVTYGELARSDLLMAQQETLSKEVLKLHAEAEVHHAKYQYQILTGLNQQPADIEELPISDAAINDDHPLLAESLAEVEKSLAEKAQTELERRANPTITLGSRHEQPNYAGQLDFQNTIGIVVRLPLGLESQAAPKLAQAAVSVAEAQSKRDQLLRVLQIELENAAHDLASTRKELEVAEQQNKLTQTNLEINQKAFELGEIDLVSIMRVQSQAFTAQRSLRQKRLELGMNTARYNQALGKLP